MSAAPDRIPIGAARLLLVAGAMVLMALWLGPLPDMARTAFSAHMLLHLGIVGLAAPLLALGAFGLGWIWRSPIAAVLSIPLAVVLDFVVVWGWHAPALHEAAARNAPIFVVQQLSFLLGALGVWTAAFRHREVWPGLAAMFLTFSHMVMLGLLLTLSPALLYAPDLCLGAFGFTQIEDQQFGGVLMASLGGLAYLAGGLLLVWWGLVPHGAPVDEPTG